MSFLKKIRDFIFTSSYHNPLPPVRIHQTDIRLKIKLNYKAHLKLKYYEKNISTEWGGMLLVSQKGNVVYITDVIFIPQTANYTYFEKNTSALGILLEKIARENPLILPKIKGWCHSHNSMGVFWSGEDDDTFRQLCDYFGDYVIGVVTNDKGEQLWRMDIKHKTFGRLVVDNLRPELILEDSAMEAECVNEIKKNLKNGYHYQGFVK